MKALLLLSLLSMNVMASEELEMTGFIIKKDNAKALTLNFRDEQQFIISKAKFKGQADAEKFCKSQNSLLDTEFNSLLIGMSGAASVNKFLEKSISFKGPGMSGIYQWTGSDNKIGMILDGQGSGTVEVLPSQLIQHKMKAELPAICVKELQPISE